MFILGREGSAKERANEERDGKGEWEGENVEAADADADADGSEPGSCGAA
jgi:hypothetical protein